MKILAIICLIALIISGCLLSSDDKTEKDSEYFDE